jgi:[ribosomal protein S18]-alanine N-acetyltransferase
MNAPAHVVITPMRRRHLKRVLAIETAINPKPWTLGVFQSELAQPDTRAYFVASIGRDVVGFAGLMMALDDGHITSIGVDPRWQRHSIATQCMIALARTARERGARALTLEVRLSNRPAHALYRRFGFAPVGARKNYYQEPEEDALIMWAHDVDSSDYESLLQQHEQRLERLVTVEQARTIVSTTGGGPKP